MFFLPANAANTSNVWMTIRRSIMVIIKGAKRNDNESGAAQAISHHSLSRTHPIGERVMQRSVLSLSLSNCAKNEAQDVMCGHYNNNGRRVS